MKTSPRDIHREGRGNQRMGRRRRASFQPSHPMGRYPAMSSTEESRGLSGQDVGIGEPPQQHEAGHEHRDAQRPVMRNQSCDQGTDERPVPMGDQRSRHVDGVQRFEIGTPGLSHGDGVSGCIKCRGRGRTREVGHRAEQEHVGGHAGKGACQAGENVAENGGMNQGVRPR